MTTAPSAPTMQAVVRDTYGSPDVLRFETIARPTPGPDEVLVRVRASSLNRADRYRLEGIPAPIRLVSGLFKPRTRGLGMDFAGDVAAVGGRVTDLKPGDAVYGDASFGEMWAEYGCVSASQVAPMPSNLTCEQAAAVPLSGTTALQGLRDFGRVTPGQSVLINGATGAVGTFAVQIARALGADVTAVCSQRNLQLVRELGAEHVIAYETEDYTACGRQFDVLFDVILNHTLRESCRVLKPGGVYLPVGGPEGRWLGPVAPLMAAMLQAPLVRPRVASFTAEANRADLEALTALIEAGAVTPAIDRTFPLAEIADAMRYLVDGHPPSKVVISM